MADKKMTDKLRLWQGRLKRNEADYQDQLDRMDTREALYRGDRALVPLTEGDRKQSKEENKTPHVRNIVAENIESQVSVDIPQPKVTARRKQDEPLAKLIEDMLRNELDRLPMEYINDMQERTVPIQGGSFFHVEWDNDKRTHTTVGEVTVSARHPKQVIPQAGVCASLEDMDYIILKLPQTKAAIKRRYGVDVEDAGEAEPEVRGSGGESPARDLVTQYIAYYRNDSGGIGLYSWTGDQELEDIEDYQARRLRRCENCGEAEPEDGDTVVDRQEMVIPDPMSAAMGMLPRTVEQSHVWHKGDACPYCGGKKWRSGTEEWEEIWDPIVTSGGTIIPGAEWAAGENGLQEMRPTKVPYYKPDVYPLVLQRNVSLFGQLLGDSDVDKIADQQNTVNRLEKKIIDRIVKAGSRILMPATATHRIDPNDTEVWYLDNVADASMIQVKDFTGNLQYEMAYLAQTYEEARQALGITDSFQGRKDTTAQSGTAKQFAAAQSAGRLESKRAMKNAAYADLFRLIFQFKLAYADEPRPVVSQDSKGNKTYSEFNRYDFLERDEAGEWYWNDQFLFSTDTSAPLANNRERMWEETISLFSAGCFGNPQEAETLIALWTKLELLHYPGAGDTRAYLEERLEQAMAMQQQAGISAAAAMPGPVVDGQRPAMTGIEQAVSAVDQQAEADAMQAVFGAGGAHPQGSGGNL